MKKVLLASAIFQLLTFNFHLSAQSDPVIMEVGGQQIRQSEFMEEFNNAVGNRMAKDRSATATQKRQALEEYVELFANFRAKLLDAHAEGFDTTPTLRTELEKYRSELAAPYLIDSVEMDRLMREAYERNHYSLHAAHILVQCRRDASDADTLKAYRHILGLRKRIADGEDFFAVAAEEMQRANPNAPARPNEGDLGYFTAFDMVYPFENAAYALEVGQLSQPIRTRYGYHIIKLLDKVPLHGRVEMAHIWLSSQNEADKRNLINSIYNQLAEGSTSFETAARSSDDRTTRDNGGLLKDARLSNLPPEYIHHLVGMKDGEVSKPFFTQYGWHIIKLIHHDTLAPIEDMMPFYKQRMARDQRGEESRKGFARKCRQRYGIVDNTVTPDPKAKKPRRGQKRQMLASLDQLMSVMNEDSVARAKWKYVEDSITDLRPLVVTPSRTYDSRDFGKYFAKHQKRERHRLDLAYNVRQQYENFIDSVAVVYADSQLEKEHADFAALLEDYRRGLMIFDYNDKKIWSKAIYDTAGFADYYSRASLTKRLDNPDDSVFFWRERARVSIITISDSNCIKRAKLQKMMTKAWKHSAGSSELAETVQKATKGTCEVTADVELVEQRNQKLLDEQQWKPGVYISPKGKGYRVLVVDEILPRTLKAQSEARGYYLNEYQNEVERKLNDELRRKYNVKINRDVVKGIRL